MAGENTVTQLNSNFKTIYGDRLKWLLSKNLQLIKSFRFKSSAKLGKTYQQPVVLKHEHGFTYAAPGASGAAGVAFIAAVPGFIENAEINGSQIFLRSALDYESAAKGASSKGAFVDSVGYLIENMWQSSQKRQEIELGYGQQQLGVLTAASTTTILTISDATWSPGIWAGQEGATLDITDGPGTSNLAVNSTTRGTILSIDMVAKTITLLAALTGAPASGSHRVFFGTQKSVAGTPQTNLVTQSMIGLDGILSNPTALHGINTASYSLWKSEQIALTSNLDIGDIETGIAKIRAKGAEGDYKLLYSPATQAKLLTNLSALTRFSAGDSKYKQGADGIVIRCGGMDVEMVDWVYCYEGSAYLINPDDFMRIGASDLTYKTPGRGDELFILTPGFGSYELQTYQNLSLFCQAPGRQARFTGIVNT